MIAYLRGKVLTTTTETAILDVNGVGYEVYCTRGAFNGLTVGAVGELHTYLQVKEDGMTLFGFESATEKELFLKLISVSGVGPKMGIAILASLSADEFALAVATADVKRLSSAKGVGKKVAEKIVLELHGKISAVEVLDASGSTLTPSVATSEKSAKLSQKDEEAVSALMGLGFTRAESMQAVKKAHEKGAETVEEIIMKALQGGM